MFTWVNYEDLVRKKVRKIKKCLLKSVNYEFQPPNLRAWGPFSYNKVPQFKRFSSYFGKSYTGFDVLKI